MKILAIEAALGAGQVALWSNHQVVEAATIEDPRSLAEHLVPTIDLILGQAGASYATVDRIVVSVGPGTFTGLRIGLAAARAISLAAECPIIGVTTLEALAFGAASNVTGGETLIVAIDARRGQVYLQAFQPKGDAIFPVAPGRAVDIHDIGDFLPGGPVLVVGSAAVLVGSARNGGVRLSEDFDRIDVGVLCAIARDRTPTGVAPAPLYLREPDAKLPKVS